MTQHIETVIVGAGQAGLATSYYLSQSQREHIVLESAPYAASAWRDGRWDSFTLVTPNWTVRMPGAEYAGPDRDGFMARAQVVAYFEQYVERFHLPIRYNTRVLSIQPMDSKSYGIQTQEGAIEADNVVIATGMEQLPKRPAFSANLSPDILQLHSSAYRNPQALPGGAVLVVGSGQSGAQIAEELYRHGRRVFLSTGSAGRTPRRYRGRDIFEGLNMIGFLDITPERLPVPREHFAPPHLSGAGGGHTLNLHQFACDGVTLLGHMRDGAGSRVSFAADLKENLAKADGFERQAQGMVDEYIHARGIDAPPEELAQRREGYAQPIVEELDLNGSGISTIIWAAGYTSDYGLVKAPVCDRNGFPIQTRGVTQYPGLYFVGMPWMPSLKSGSLLGVGEAARHIASHIMAR